MQIIKNIPKLKPRAGKRDSILWTTVIAKALPEVAEVVVKINQNGASHA